jgi:transcription initiation factor TFIIIB Brf1 subunit/transcription initiation factor TFIIB
MKTLKIDAGIITPEDFISRFCKILKLNGQVEFSALQISKRSNKQKTKERSPITRAAAAIYIASQHAGNPRTTDLISEVTGVGKRTIRDCSKQMEKIMKISKTNE